MRLGSLIVALISFTTAGPALAGGVTTGGLFFPAVMMVHPDQEILTARKRARDTIATFIERLRKRNPTDLEFAVQVSVTDGDIEEHIWLADVRYERGFFRGSVDSRPLQIETVALGQRLRIAASEITDWMIVERTLHGERVVGAFTLKVLESREFEGIIPELAAFDGRGL